MAGVELRISAEAGSETLAALRLLAESVASIGAEMRELRAAISKLGWNELARRERDALEAGIAAASLRAAWAAEDADRSGAVPAPSGDTAPPPPVSDAASQAPAAGGSESAAADAALSAELTEQPVERCLPIADEPTSGGAAAGDAPAAQLPPPDVSGRGPYPHLGWCTPERRDILTREWKAGTFTDKIRDMLAALPGPVLPPNKTLTAKAITLAGRRPVWTGPVQVAASDKNPATGGAGDPLTTPVEPRVPVAGRPPAVPAAAPTRPAPAPEKPRGLPTPPNPPRPVDTSKLEPVAADVETIASGASTRRAPFTGDNLPEVNQVRLGLGLPPFVLKKRAA